MQAIGSWISLLQFGSDNGEDLDTGTDAEELDLSAQAGGMRKSGKRYTEFDFDFLDHKWLELSDEGSDHIDSGSSSKYRLVINTCFLRYHSPTISRSRYRPAILQSRLITVP